MILQKWVFITMLGSFTLASVVCKYVGSVQFSGYNFNFTGTTIVRTQVV